MQPLSVFSEPLLEFSSFGDFSMRARVPSDSGFSSDSTDTTTEPYRDQPPHPSVYFLEKKLTEIKSAKEDFLRNFSRANTDIENTSRSLVACAQARSQTLKSLLKEIGDSKIQEWDRQLNVCREAEEKLRSIHGIDAIQAAGEEFAAKIGFVDAGEVGIDLNDTHHLMKIEKFGKLSTTSVLPLEKLTPKIVLEQLNKPWGVCCDATGRILITDRTNNRIQVFNEYRKFLFTFGRPGTRPGEFDHPTGVTVDKKLRILVSDTNNHRIQVFAYTGGFLFTFGGRGSKPGQFLHPWDVAVNGNGDVAVSDSYNHRVQLFDPHGSLITIIGFNISQGLRVCPRGVAFRPDDSLLLTDRLNNSVFLIDKNWETVEEFRAKGTNFFKPEGVACDSLGSFLIADGRNYIQVFDEFGNLCRTFGGYGAEPGEFDDIRGVCFQPDGGLIVADLGNNRIQIF